MKTFTRRLRLLCGIICIAIPFLSSAQETVFQRFQGKVTNLQGEPLVGVNIYLPGVGRGTLTDREGVFYILAKDKETLYFSYQGMKEVHLQLSKDKRKGIIVQMAPEIRWLDEVTVTKNKYIAMDEIMEDDTYNFCLIEEKAVFPDGQEGLKTYLKQALQYPENAFRKGEEGQVIVAFTVTKEGKVENAEVTQSVSPELDKEAMRIIQGMPRWQPAFHRGRPVDTRLAIPVNFGIIVNYVISK